jgi:hypothetical protein
MKEFNFNEAIEMLRQGHPVDGKDGVLAPLVIPPLLPDRKLRLYIGFARCRHRRKQLVGVRYTRALFQRRRHSTKFRRKQLLRTYQQSGVFNAFMQSVDADALHKM